MRVFITIISAILVIGLVSPAIGSCGAFQSTNPVTGRATKDTLYCP